MILARSLDPKVPSELHITVLDLWYLFMGSVWYFITEDSKEELKVKCVWKETVLE